MSEKKDSKNLLSQELVCVDLFAGAGGFSLAAMQAGFRVAAAVELNAHACKTYKKNIADAHGVSLYEGDILQFSPASALLHNSTSGQASPDPRRSYATATVWGVPSSVN